MNYVRGVTLALATSPPIERGVAAPPRFPPASSQRSDAAMSAIAQGVQLETILAYSLNNAFSIGALAAATG
jgi:hypothetical protein